MIRSMAGMETNSVRLRRAFTEATRNISDLAGVVTPEQWSRPATDRWTVRDLFVHASRAASTITTYASSGAERTLHSAAEYYLSVLDAQDLHDAVAERARTQAAEIDEPIPEYLARVFAEAEQTLQRTPAAQVLDTRGGGITLEDYLPTRVVELVVHGIDIADSLEVRPEVPDTAMSVTLETLADLCALRADVLDPATLVRTLTGRGTLPEATNLLG